MVEQQDPDELKAALRRRIGASRRAMSDADRELARRAIVRVTMQWCQHLPPASRLACYQPQRTEPGSQGLLTGLAAAGFELIVPITRPDNDLDWGRWSPDASVATPALGCDAIGTAALVLLPAFAVDSEGNRLGRGGGSYDRALPRAAIGAVLAAILFDGEFTPKVPTQPWDRKVNAVITPGGFTML